MNVIDHVNHTPPGGNGLLVWVISAGIYGVTQLFGWLGNFDSWVVVGLHLLSFVSLVVGITAGVVTIQDKLRARKKKD